LLCLGVSKIDQKQLNFPIGFVMSISGTQTPNQLGFEGG
jgi:hypothetical protein